MTRNFDDDVSRNTANNNVEILTKTFFPHFWFPITRSCILKLKKNKKKLLNYNALINFKCVTYSTYA